MSPWSRKSGPRYDYGRAATWRALSSNHLSPASISCGTCGVAAAFAEESDLVQRKPAPIARRESGYRKAFSRLSRVEAKT